MKRISTPAVFLIAYLLMCCVYTAQAQKKQLQDSLIENRCVQTLRQSEKAYDAGLIDKIEALLLPCIESESFSKFEKIQAYRLIILTKLNDNEDEEANAYFVKLLKLDPEYQINVASDPSEFVQLYNSYRTNPIYSLGVKAGVNLTTPTSFVPYGVYNTAENTGSYKSLLNVQFGFNADFNLSKKIAVGTDLMLSFKKFQYKNILMGYSELTSVEGQMCLELPVLLKYTMGKKKTRFYVQGGGAVSMILNSSSNITRKDLATQSNQAIGPDINTKGLRNIFNYSLVGGGGIRYKAGYGYVVLDVRYMYGLNNISDTDSKYSNDELIYKYGYIDNNFTLNSLMFSVGYYKSFYKPKKLPKHEK